MQLADCYRILGLARNASWEDIKSSYRRLVRRYHPDLNGTDPMAAAKFQRVQEAYQVLRGLALGETPVMPSPDPSPTPSPPPKPPTAPKVKISVTPPKEEPSVTPQEKLRIDMLKRTQDLLRQRKYPVAIAMLEGMQERFANAPEVTHWLAVAYQRYGNEFLQVGKLREAEAYLQKALRADPNNRELCFEIKYDLERLRRESID